MTANQIAEKMNQAGHTTTDGKAFTGNNISTALHREKNRKAA
jgi:hypothetical protein